MSSLPIFKHREQFFKLLHDNQALVVVGETGSGKTTQIPQWCLTYCKRTNIRQSIGCTQPRKIAAMSIAGRVAKELHVELGRDVGYSVRFDNCSGQKTRLKYITDGMLLREAMLDGLLKNYAIIILDEAHERTLQTEVLFGVIKRALNSRNSKDNDLPPLKVIAMSATINVKLFRKYLNSPVLHIEGRQYPVQDMFAEVHQSDLLTSTLITVFQIHRTHDSGDILVFCSGQDEIQSLITLCKKVLKHAPEKLKQLEALPLYAALPAAHQMKVFDRSISTNARAYSNFEGDYRNGISNSDNKAILRRVIFATNVAETSVTIPNIKYVIDTGKVKCRRYCPKTGLETLKIRSISKAQAGQRSGRAGRTSEGTCYRLYTDEEFSKMDDHLPAEIKRCNMDSVLLQLISIGIKNIDTFEFLERPEDARLKAALNSLLSLKAIKATSPTNHNATEKNNFDQKNRKLALSNGGPSHISAASDDNTLKLDYDLTELGKKLSTFPLSPQMSRIILAANELGCLDDALTVISLLSIESLFYFPPNRQNQAEAILEKFHSNEGDPIMLLKVFKAFKRTSVIDRPGLKLWCAEHFIHAKNLRLSRSIRKQLSEICKSIGMQSSTCGQDTSVLRRALTYGFYNNVATMWNGKYRNKSSDEIYIHPSSCLAKVKPENIMYLELVETNKCYMRMCTLVDMSWVREISSANSNSLV